MRRQGKLKDRITTNYPEAPRENREQGTVRFHAMIEGDGSVSHLTAINQVTPSLDAAAARAITLWR